MKKIKNLLKKQKGFTLVELLAVIVILGIIAAIAIPSIGNIIDNSKKDAHVANAEMLIESTRLAVAANEYDLPTAEGDTVKIKMSTLVTDGYLEHAIIDPDTNEPYTTGIVTITKGASGYSYSVTLQGEKRSINNVLSSDLGREKVKNTAKATTPEG